MELETSQPPVSRNRPKVSSPTSLRCSNPFSAGNGLIDGHDRSKSMAQRTKDAKQFFFFGGGTSKKSYETPLELRVGDTDSWQKQKVSIKVHLASLLQFFSPPPSCSCVLNLSIVSHCCLSPDPGCCVLCGTLMQRSRKGFKDTMNIFFQFGTWPPAVLLILISSLRLCVDAVSDYSIASFDNPTDLNLSSACNTVYQQPIPSCQPYDFNALNPCSSSCIQSLQSVQTEAQAACASQSIPANSMLSYFRDGNGVNQLCSVMKSVSTTLSSQASPAAASSTQTTSTVPAGAGGVSFASEAAADPSQTKGMALSKDALTAVIVVVVVGSILMLLVSIFLYRKHYLK
ncbi:uncharacterized protein PV09_02722 [Verruconis gallopava]|uniref:Uncharacterized protein n=1 Tax=Verruconis gallopava TaxID=253628 RepID=A0A0D2B4T2_9PEZI|nr:uncharacterized protein PV09_02722 [Verruconis gallopava]KIW06249.1 hypothetical protein PV09_02722 [Verruconis gallopava]